MVNKNDKEDCFCQFICYHSSFYTSARCDRKGDVVTFVRRRLRRRTQPFGYHTNMVPQIEFIIIHTNSQPLRK